MAVPVDAVPTSLEFPGVMPGSFGPDITPVGDLPSFNGGVHIRSAPVAASVTFTLVDETGHFSLRDVYVLELVSEIVGGGDGNPEGPPPGMVAVCRGDRMAGAAASTCWRWPEPSTARRRWR